MKREVDFLVVRDGTPWFLVEVKNRDESVGKNLGYFQDQLRAPFAFQVVIEADYVEALELKVFGRDEGRQDP